MLNPGRTYLAFSSLSLLAGLSPRLEPCNLHELLPRISRSAQDLARSLSGAVAWEDYEQQVLEADDRTASVGMKLVHNTLSAKRRLGSDILLLRLPSGRFFGFRDVAEVDGQEVAERGERIRRLFLDEKRDPDETAGLIEESARFNIGDIERDLNVPTLILPLLSDEPGGIDRLELETGDDGPSDGTCAVSFFEARGPYLVGTGNGKELPLRGTLYVTPENGRLERVSIQAGRLATEHIELTVEFDAFDGWDQPLPSRMTEIYAHRTSVLVTRCEARYSNYRRFSVDTTEKWRVRK
jgi:hypothetical protein